MSTKKLGFGFMRLPVVNGQQDTIDFDQLFPMVDEYSPRLSSIPGPRLL